MDWMVIALALLGAYLLGSLPFAVLVSRAMGLQDPRTFGSGNPGATNVLRSGSKLAAALTLLLDAAKGWLPVALMGWYGPRYGLWEGAQAFVGLAAFAGHVWPLFLRFRGGKGVATALGVLLGLSPWLGLAVLLVWLLVLAGSRISSLSSIVAAIAAPVIYVLGASQLWPYAPSAQLALIVMTLVLLYRHGGNIARLMQGAEPRIGQGKQAAQAGAAPAEPGAPAPSAAALRNARKAERKKHKRTRHGQR